MSRSDLLRLLLLVLVASAFVLALDTPRGPHELATSTVTVTGGYAVAANAPLPPRAQPSARNVQHSSSEVAT